MTAGLARSSRGSASSPPSPGMCRSSRMRSGWCSPATTMASSPSSASATTSNPARSSAIRIRLRMSSVSSTTTTLRAGGARRRRRRAAEAVPLPSCGTVASVSPLRPAGTPRAAPEHMRRAPGRSAGRERAEIGKVEWNRLNFWRVEVDDGHTGCRHSAAFGAHGGTTLSQFGAEKFTTRSREAIEAAQLSATTAGNTPHRADPPARRAAARPGGHQPQPGRQGRRRRRRPDRARPRPRWPRCPAPAARPCSSPPPPRALTRVLAAGARPRRLA